MTRNAFSNFFDNFLKKWDSLRMKRFVYFLLLFISSLASASESVPGVFLRGPAPQALYVIERDKLSNADWHLAVIIQGMVNREQPRIYIVDRGSETRGDEVLLSYYSKEYNIKNLGEIPLQQALEKYAGLFKGYALFAFDEPWTVNVTDVYCSIYDCLPVTAEQEALARKVGLEKVEDFRGRWKQAQDAIKWTRRELFPRCSPKIIASLQPQINSCRDYLFAHKIFTFYLQASGEEYPGLRKLLKGLPSNIPVMGYIARNGFEEWIVEYTLAETGKFMVATDSVPNLTVHSGIPVKPLPELKQWSKPPDLRGKLGVVFALTDGDNLVIQSESYLRPDFWLYPGRGKIKVAWSVAPELYELAPGIMRYYYDTRTPNDFFVALSGAGYTFSSALADKAYFGKISTDYMKLTGLDVLWALDPLLYFAANKKVVSQVFNPLGNDGFTRGILAGYAPSLNLRNWQKVEGYPPIMYCKSNYFITPNKILLASIKADAAYIPKRGKLAFYGVNGWKVRYQDLLGITRDLSRRKDIIFLSPQEAFAILEKWDK